MAMPVLSSRIVMRVFLPAFIFPVNCKLCVTGKATGNNSAGHGCETGSRPLAVITFRRLLGGRKYDSTLLLRQFPIAEQSYRDA